MAFTRQYYCLFLVALALAGMCQSGQGLNLNDLNIEILDICKKADYPTLCRSVVKGLKNPSLAIETTIRQLMVATNLAKSTARRSKSSEMEVCYETYDDAYSNLETCLSNLKSGDERGLNINLSAALTDYVTCDDAVTERGAPTPITRTNVMLREMAANCLYLSSLIHFR